MHQRRRYHETIYTMSDSKKPAPLSGYERVKRHRQKLAAAGVRAYPNSPIPPDAAQALDALLAAGYAPSATAAISRALVEAASREIDPKGV